MKYVIVLVLAAVVAGSAAIYLTRNTPATASAAANTGGQDPAVADRERKLQELEAEKRRAEAEKENLLRLTKEMGTQLEAQSRALTNIATNSLGEDSKGPGGFGKMVSSMLKDPETRNFIREQQRTMVDQMYEPLVKQLGLSPEKSEQFRSLVLDNMMQAADKGMAAFGAGGSQNQDEMVKALSEDHKAYEAQVRELLGEDGYAKYQEYSVTLQERTQLNMFRQQIGGSGITDEQSERLLAIMREEKQNPNNNLPEFMRGGDKGPEAMKAMMDKEQTAKLLEAQEGLNLRVQERAGEVLGADQLNAFARFQSNQMNMMKFGLSMAQKMFGSDEPGPAPAPGK